MKLYYLENKEQQAQAIVSPIGGQVISYIKDGQEIIYLQRVVEGKIRGGIPICFPFFGPPKPRFAGIPQHGWLRNEELKVKDVLGKGSEFAFEGFGEYDRKIYPWSLKYDVSACITSLGSLMLKLWIQRQKDGIKENAPINLAIHPYFTNLGRRAVKIGQKEIKNFGSKAEIIPLNGEKEITIDLGKKKVEMLLTDNFANITLWTDSKQYFCVEPSLTHPDDFDTPKGKYLKQGEVLTLGCILSILP